MKRPTTKSYAGRQVDIEALKHVEKMLRIQRVHPDVNTDPRIVAGIEKAVQRYAKLFLTEIGSMKLSPNVGSRLVSRARNGSIANYAVLDSLYATANRNAVLAIRADDENDAFGEIPDDERIVNVRLVEMLLDRKTATIKIHVFIETASGDTYTFIIPVEAGISM